MVVKVVVYSVGSSPIKEVVVYQLPFESVEMRTSPVSVETEPSSLVVVKVVVYSVGSSAVIIEVVVYQLPSESVETVSYTHLDVYKRQGEGPLPTCRSEHKVFSCSNAAGHDPFS